MSEDDKRLDRAKRIHYKFYGEVAKAFKNVAEKIGTESKKEK